MRLPHPAVVTALRLPAGVTDGLIGAGFSLWKLALAKDQNPQAEACATEGLRSLSVACKLPASLYPRCVREAETFGGGQWGNLGIGSCQSHCCAPQVGRFLRARHNSQSGKSTAIFHVAFPRAGSGHEGRHPRI